MSKSPSGTKSPSGVKSRSTVTISPYAAAVVAVGGALALVVETVVVVVVVVVAAQIGIVPEKDKDSSVGAEGSSFSDDWWCGRVEVIMVVSRRDRILDPFDILLLCGTCAMVATVAAAQ